MATIRRKLGALIGEALNGYQEVINTPVVTNLTSGDLNKLWRAGMLLHRLTHLQYGTTGFPIDTKTDPATLKVRPSLRILGKVTGLDAFGVTGVSGNMARVKQFKRSDDLKVSNAKLNSRNDLERLELQEKLINLKREILSGDGNTISTRNDVIIYNISFPTGDNEYEYIVLQNRPNEISFQGETSWASIKSMGRNVPIYQYTGAEDIIQFNTSWYCTSEESYDEVVNKCRFLERWTKGNGYLSSPPFLQLQWGSNPDKDIFAGHFYILTSATYKLRDFSDCVRSLNGGNNRGDSKWKVLNHNLTPMAATQELVFKRVSGSNLTYHDFLPSSKLKGLTV